MTLDEAVSIFVWLDNDTLLLDVRQIEAVNGVVALDRGDRPKMPPLYENIVLAGSNVRTKSGGNYSVPELPAEIWDKMAEAWIAARKRPS